MLITKIEGVKSLLAKVESVSSLVAHMKRKDGNSMIWKVRRFFVSIYVVFQEHVFPFGNLDSVKSTLSTQEPIPGSSGVYPGIKGGVVIEEEDKIE